MAETPADQAFAQEWRQVTQELARDQIRELTAGLSWTEAVAAIVLRVRRLSAEQLEELDPRIHGVPLSRTPPLPWPDAELLAAAMVAYWCPGQWPDAPEVPSQAQLEEIAREAERAEAAFWGAPDQY